MPITEWERWAVAHRVLEQHGERAIDHCAERAKALALAGDEHGVALWVDIAGRIDQLRGPSGGERLH